MNFCEGSLLALQAIYNLPGLHILQPGHHRELLSDHNDRCSLGAVAAAEDVCILSPLTLYPDHCCKHAIIFHFCCGNDMQALISDHPKPAFHTPEYLAVD